MNACVLDLYALVIGCHANLKCEQNPESLVQHMSQLSAPTHPHTHPPTNLPCGEAECSANESEGVGPFAAATCSCLKELRDDERKGAER